ncbi:MAG: outer membrane lipoprotein-sorting protein [Pseudohongiellaceae bacterium]
MNEANWHRGLHSTLTALILLVIPAAAHSEQGREIMEQVEDNQRALTEAAFNRIELSSCRYGLQDNRITCAERPRVKSLETVHINTGPDSRDTRTISIVREPAAERGVGMLSYTYDDVQRDNETWLYLSALGQVKRIAAGNSEDDYEPASLFGSEFTTEDQDTGKLDDYTIRVLEKTEEAGRPVWKIEAIPDEARMRKTRYVRIVHYVDQERFVVLRSDMYDRQGREIKRLMASRIEQVDGVWTARSLTMLNLVSNRLSNMATREINTGIDIPADFLTPRTLTDVAYRESELERLREQTDTGTAD